MYRLESLTSGLTGCCPYDQLLMSTKDARIPVERVADREVLCSGDSSSFDPLRPNRLLIPSLDSLLPNCSGRNGTGTSSASAMLGGLALLEGVGCRNKVSRTGSWDILEGESTRPESTGNRRLLVIYEDGWRSCDRQWG
jgi:hypothetical protein